MASESLRRLLETQRKRLLAAILGYAERELYPDLTEHQQRVFRGKVLDSVSAYHALMLDILGAANDGTELINVEAMELLRDVRDELRAQHRRAG